MTSLQLHRTRLQPVYIILWRVLLKYIRSILTLSYALMLYLQWPATIFRLMSLESTSALHPRRSVSDFLRDSQSHPFQTERLRRQRQSRTEDFISTMSSLSNLSRRSLTSILQHLPNHTCSRSIISSTRYLRKVSITVTRDTATWRRLFATGQERTVNSIQIRTICQLR